MRYIFLFDIRDRVFSFVNIETCELNRALSNYWRASFDRCVDRYAGI